MGGSAVGLGGSAVGFGGKPVGLGGRAVGLGGSAVGFSTSTGTPTTPIAQATAMRETNRLLSCMVLDVEDA